MKTLVLTPSTSSAKSTATTMSSAAADDDYSETRDSCYFPGCRKDANCNCDICLASINATLDLMPLSVQRSSRAKLSAAKPAKPRSPVSFNSSSFTSSSVMSTPPGPRLRRVIASPPLKSTARMSFSEKLPTKKKKRQCGFFGLGLIRLVLCLSLIFVAESGFSWLILGVFEPELSADVVRSLGEKSFDLGDLNERLEFLKKELEGLVEDEVSNCSSVDSIWEMNRDGLLLNSRCTLYKSATEEVSIWGWPLQTAGLLTSEFSSRSFTILSGRVTEWSSGKMSYSIKNANSSWAQEKWSSSAVQIDPNTWVLEYRQSLLTENSRLLSAAMEFLTFRLKRELKTIKQEFWLLSAFGSHYSDFTEAPVKTPT